MCRFPCDESCDRIYIWVRDHRTHHKMELSPAKMLKNARNKRNGSLALYALWVHSLWTPPVTPYICTIVHSINTNPSSSSSLVHTIAVIHSVMTSHSPVFSFMSSSRVDPYKPITWTQIQPNTLGHTISIRYCRVGLANNSMGKSNGQ